MQRPNGQDTSSVKGPKRTDLLQPDPEPTVCALPTNAYINPNKTLKPPVRPSWALQLCACGSVLKYSCTGMAHTCMRCGVSWLADPRSLPMPQVRVARPSARAARQGRGVHLELHGRARLRLGHHALYPRRQQVRAPPHPTPLALSAPSAIWHACASGAALSSTLSHRR